MGLYRRKDSNVWWFTITYKGKRIREPLKTDNKKLAERVYAKILIDMVEDRYFEKPDSVAMAEVIDRYMKEISPLREGSHERNKQTVKHLKAFLGETLLENVTPSLLSQYKSLRLQTHTKKGAFISPSTVRKELSFLRQVFNVAIDEWELCKETPVKKVIKSLPQDEKRVRYVTPEEAQKLRFTIPDWLRPIVITACQTGLRRGNLINLALHQLDFTASRIVIGKTKNGDPLGISMTKMVKETLLNVIKARCVTGPYVFCDEKGKRYSPSQVSMAFKRACKRAGVENLRLHDLRHDFATLMLRKRKNLVEVQHAMGHKDPRMTLRYAHLLPDDLKDAFEAIDNEGTAFVWSRFGHVEEKEKGIALATP